MRATQSHQTTPKAALRPETLSEVLNAPPCSRYPLPPPLTAPSLALSPPALSVLTFRLSALGPRLVPSCATGPTPPLANCKVKDSSVECCLRERENADEALSTYGPTTKGFLGANASWLSLSTLRKGVLCSALQNSWHRRQQDPTLTLQLTLDVAGREDWRVGPSLASGCEKRFVLGFNETGEPREEAPTYTRMKGLRAE